MLENGFAQNAISVRLTAPVHMPDSGPLHLTATSCRGLRSLSLDFATLPSLIDLKPLRSTLKRLQIRASLPQFTPLDEDPGHEEEMWMEWVSCLTRLTDLEITAVLPTLLDERGLVALLPLKGLRKLKLQDCTLATDTALATLTSLPRIQELSILPSKFSATGIQTLKSKLPHLISLECTLRTVDAASTLLRQEVEKQTNPKTSGYHGLDSFSLHLSMCQTDIRTVFQSNGVLSEGIPSHARHFTLGLSGIRLHLAQQQGPLPHLQTLKLVNIECGDDAAAQFAAIPRLKSLSIALSPTARDGAISSWKMMTNLTHLDLRGTWYLSEHSIASALSSMPAMQCLALSSLQGDAGSMLSALCEMHDLHTFTLSSCRLTDIEALAPILSSRSRSLTSLSLRWTGNCENLANMAATAIPNLPRLRNFELQIYVPPSLAVQYELSTAFTNAPALTTLNVRYSPQHGNYRQFNIAPHSLFLHPQRAASSSNTNLNLQPAVVHFVPAEREAEKGQEQQLASTPQWETLAINAPRLRTLTVSPGMGWTLESLIAVCTRDDSQLRNITVVDGQGVVTSDWIDVIAHLPCVTVLSLEACRVLQGPKVFQALARATSLTELSAVGCPGLANVAEVARLRQKLPALAKCAIHPHII